MSDWDSDGFQVYEAQTRPRRLAPDEVSLTKTNIVISEELAQKFGHHTQVVLLYNKEAEEIGIRPIMRGEQGYKVSYRSISSRSFYQFFDIKARGRFKGRVNRMGMLVVSLKKAKKR